MTHGFETLAIHAGQEPDPTTGAVVPPIYQVSTFKQDGVGGLRGGYEYARSGNPTRTALEECLAALEGGRRGLAFASGLAAEDTVLRTVLSPGDHVVIPDDAYGGTYRLFSRVHERWGVAHTPARLSDVDAVRAAVVPGKTRIVWVETPTNPLLGIADIEALAGVAHDAGALLVVDNTFASPYLQQPIALGADVVVHSTTKYLGGHSDVVGGALVVADDELGERLAYHQNAMGAVAGPFDSWLVLRGAKTLGVRMDRHCANAARVVELLVAHPAVSQVYWPGLPEHAGHDVAVKQMKDFGGMVSFRVAGGEDAALAVCAKTEVFTLGESLGGVESLIEHPGRMTHASVAGSALEVPADLVRLSVGIETVDDLLADLSQALGLTAAVSRVLCVDVGSTFTKAALVEVPSGRLLATATHPTTIGTDVLEGLEAVRAAAESVAGSPAHEVRACSSAGGGLRLAVVGYERAVTSEAGSRVGLSAGARVVHVSAGPMDGAAVRALRADRPDVILLVGGTDGGNAEVLLHNARRLAAARLKAPVVVAGNVEARDQVCSLLEAGGRTALPTANVLPRIGVLDPSPARAAIREVFITHVIGGKGLSRGPAFGRMVRAATPDAVLAGVELLADGAEDVPGVGDVVVVDVGGATTDVYSVVTPDPEEASLHREVVEVLWRERTVEGDLGMRWNAPGVVTAAMSERLLGASDPLEDGAVVRANDPGWLPTSAAEREDDLALARLAVTVALRRHARPSDPVVADGPRRAGKDLRSVGLVVGSGGVLRHASEGAAEAVLGPALSDHAGGWKTPEHPRLVVDRSYVLAAAGLLSVDQPGAAARLLRDELT